MKLKMFTGREIALSATQCYSSSDVEDAIQRRMASNKVFVDFAGEFIQVESAAEVRIVSALVCAYHNCIVRENIKDPTYDAYKEEASLATDSSAYESETPTPLPKLVRNKSTRTAALRHSPTPGVPSNKRCSRTSRNNRASQVLREHTQDVDVNPWINDDNSWDEEEYGSRVVYDATYEINAELVPWNQERRSDWGLEKWGMYK